MTYPFVERILNLVQGRAVKSDDYIAKVLIDYAAAVKKETTDELDRLRAENARLTADHAAAIALVADVRAAIGDNGQRMQPALIEYVLCLRADAERYRVIRDWPNRDNLEMAIVSSSKASMYGASLDRVVDAARGVK